MNLEQLDLVMPARERDDTACEVEVRELCGLLRARGWVTRKQLLKWRPKWSERKLRAIASASGARIVSHPGSPGYRLASEATLAELWRCRNAHHHQMTQHARRITEIDQAIHKRAGEAPRS